MKKALALIVAMVMLLSLAACGNDTATGSTPEATDGQTTPVDKQALYEAFFTGENFETAGKSVRFSNEYMNIAVVQDHSENRMMEIGVLENYIRVYQLKDGKQYINIKIVDNDGTATDGWGEYEGENAVEESGVDVSVGDLKLDSITKVEYVETKDGTDIVKVYQVNPDYNENVKTTEYQIAFEYNGEACELIVTTENDGEGGESTGFDMENVPEDFDTFNYTVDFENMVLVNYLDESENIPFEITSQKEVAVDSEIGLEVHIDEATQKVTSMQQMHEGELVTVEFYDVASCLDGVEIPETLEKYDEEDLGAAILGIIFSAINFETE